MKKGKLKVTTLNFEEIHLELKEQMWQLYYQNYDDVTREQFELDLAEKNKIFIGMDERTGEFAGFSAMKLYFETVNNKKIGVIYSGDTMFRKEYWGQKGLHKCFFLESLKFKLKNPFTPFYWLFISMGYKTYLIMAKNCLEYWPHYHKLTPPNKLEILNVVSSRKFGHDFHPETGIVSFSNVKCKLSNHVAKIDETILELPEVNFLVKKNPGFQNGDELVSIINLNFRWLIFLGYKNTLSSTIKYIKKFVRKKLNVWGITQNV